MTPVRGQGKNAHKCFWCIWKALGKVPNRQKRASKMPPNENGMSDWEWGENSMARTGDPVHMGVNTGGSGSPLSKHTSPAGRREAALQGVGEWARGREGSQTEV